MSDQEWINWSNKFLTESFEPAVGPKLKKYEIMLTPDHFIRLRKTYQQGKQEYYSFSIKRFAAITYLNSGVSTDTLKLQTQADDIIVQTYNDPKGDVDSMATTLNIPVKKIAASKIDSLKLALSVLKARSL
ncbi:hypothetical protein [Mucilaginibacter sp.]|uniref:hypothetical protein n=1 Tax=Mucilaginibacter sp. TaxID=1882438 RepID=UPI0035BC434C